jgi:hypothetical protein
MVTAPPRPGPPPPPPGPYGRVPAGALRPRAIAEAEARDLPMIRSTFGLPNLRRNVCPHFYMTSPRGTIPIHAPHLLKALMRQESNVSRCQLRGGVHLETGYVSDICFSARFNQCVFYEDELTNR